MLILFRVFRSPSIVADCAGLLTGSHKLNLFLEICGSTCQQETSTADPNVDLPQVARLLYTQEKIALEK